MIDGPFAEAKEVIGGFGILKADSKEEAIRLGMIFMQIHIDTLGPGYEGELEIRQMHDTSPGEQPKILRLTMRASRSRCHALAWMEGDVLVGSRDGHRYTSRHRRGLADRGRRG